MKIQVKLFGTLPDVYPGTYPESGLEVTIEPDTSVADLVDLLQLPRERVALVSVNGLLSKADQNVPDGAEVKLFQTLHGG